MRTTKVKLENLNVVNTIKPAFATTKFILANEINEETVKAYLVDKKTNKAIELTDLAINEVEQLFKEISTKNKSNDIGWYKDVDNETEQSILDYTIEELEEKQWIIGGYRITE